MIQIKHELPTIPAQRDKSTKGSSLSQKLYRACIHASCSNSSQANLSESVRVVSEGFHCNVLVTHAETQ